MLPDERDAKTYQDLIWLLPEVAKITMWWTRDEDGLPQFIERVAMRGHDGQLLIETSTDDVEDLPSFMLDELSPAERRLSERLPAALSILAWLDASSLPWEREATIVSLPSASHVGDEPPQDWAEQ